MKKTLFISMLILGISYCSFGQMDNENPQYTKQLKLVERNLMQSKEDTKAIELIRQTRDARKARDLYVQRAPGYGEAAVNPAKLNKFREKLRKKDTDYQQVEKTFLDKQKEKREYISSVDENYKATYDKIIAESESN